MRPHLQGITASTLHQVAGWGQLRGSPMLRTLSRDDLTRLLEESRWSRFARGHNLTLDGSRPSACWLLLTGYVKEHRPLEDGSDALTSFRGPGDLVGEVAAVTRAACEHDVTAIGPGEALSLPVDRLHQLARERPSIQQALLVAMANRATRTEAVLARNQLYDTGQRIGLALLELSDRWGIVTSRGVTIALPLTQAELAEWVGASRETAAKVLHRLRQSGLIETSRRRLVIHDLDALRVRTRIAHDGALAASG